MSTHHALELPLACGAAQIRSSSKQLNYVYSNSLNQINMEGLQYTTEWDAFTLRVAATFLSWSKSGSKHSVTVTSRKSTQKPSTHPAKPPRIGNLEQRHHGFTALSPTNVGTNPLQFTPMYFALLNKGNTKKHNATVRPHTTC